MRLLLYNAVASTNNYAAPFVSPVSKEMLTLADTHKALKHRRLDKEKQDYARELQLKEATDTEAGVYQGFHFAPKSHYMYNVPLIPKVVCFVAEVILSSS